MNRPLAVVISFMLCWYVIIALAILPIDLFFWLAVLAYVWYGWGEFKRERKMREIQNQNNLEMETI